MRELRYTDIFARCCVVRMGHVIVSMGGREVKGMGMIYLLTEVCFLLIQYFLLSANVPLICWPCFLRLYAAHKIFLMC
jgi:hypothetical protein